MALETTIYDSADYLSSHLEVAAYVDVVLEDGDPVLVTHAIGVIERAAAKLGDSLLFSKDIKRLSACAAKK
jgi:DNA-binding phage protein